MELSCGPQVDRRRSTILDHRDADVGQGGADRFFSIVTTGQRAQIFDSNRHSPLAIEQRIVRYEGRI